MGYRAGIRPTDLLTIDRKPGPAADRKFKRAKDVKTQPAEASVHAVDDHTGKTLCRSYDADTLVDAGGPWHEWLPRYRCHVCSRIAPVV